jgi:hypothetical protein
VPKTVDRSLNRCGNISKTHAIEDNKQLFLNFKNLQLKIHAWTFAVFRLRQITGVWLQVLRASPNTPEGHKITTKIEFKTET